MPGFYTPLENLKNTLLRFKNSSKIEGVIYVHDDGILNITDLSNGGQYPFPTDQIIANGDKTGKFLNAYSDVRKWEGVDKVTYKRGRFSYRIFKDGHLEDYWKGNSYENIVDMYNNGFLEKWQPTYTDYCGVGQTHLAMDADSDRYREEDGSILFPRRVQADFLFVPTKFADEFAIAANLHLKHKIYIECAFNKVVDMVRSKTEKEEDADADVVRVRHVYLCTEWDRTIRGTGTEINNCIQNEDVDSYGFYHPYKIGTNGRRKYSEFYDRLQSRKHI